MNLRKHLHPWIEWLKRASTNPRSELTRWERAARFAYDLCRYGARQLREDKAPQMAGALSFRTLFGLLPVIVVATVLVRAFRGMDQMMEWLGALFARLELDQYQIEETAEGQTAPSESLSQWLLGFVSQAEELNLPAIGWLGLAVLVYSAVGLMVTIENSFNTVFRAPSGRAWTRRLTLYWTVLTLGPVAMGSVSFLNARWSAWLTSTSAWPWLATAAPAVSAFFATVLILFAIYRLVPNTTVAFRPALAGAIVTAILLQLGARGLDAYLENVVSFRVLYGSLGLVPLFMFWVYLMWLVVLFGLEVAATLQMLGGRRLEEIERRAQPTGIVEPAAVLVVMEIVAEAFERGHSATARSVAEESGVPEVTVRRMLSALAAGGFVHWIEGGQDAVALARPPGQIAADAMLGVGWDLVERGGGGRRSDLVERLRAAQSSLASQLTLGGALKAPAPGGR